MAGRFLTVEETALQLGVEPEEINRLVDRKKLFPMRDGGTMKFRYDDVVRYAQTKDESSDVSSGLSLDFDMKDPAAKSASGLELDLEGVEIGEAVGDGASIFDDPGPTVSKIVSETVLRGDAIEASSVSVASGGSLPGVSGIAMKDKLGDSLALGSLAMGSVATGSVELGSVAGGSVAVPGSGATGGVGGGTADLSGLLGSGGVGSSLAGSGIAGVTGVADGAGLSVAGESGLSLEDDDVQLSGIQLSGVDLSNAGLSVAEASGIDLGAVGDEDGGGAEGGTMLAGDAFELGAEGGDEESASVVIATDSESGDSSFFGATMLGGDASSSDDSSMQVATSGMQFPVEVAAGTTFSGLQICGLISCALLLLAGGFICFDLVRSIGSVRGAAFSTPILDSLTSTFGLK